MCIIIKTIVRWYLRMNNWRKLHFEDHWYTQKFDCLSKRTSNDHDFKRTSNDHIRCLSKRTSNYQGLYAAIAIMFARFRSSEIALISHKIDAFLHISTIACRTIILSFQSSSRHLVFFRHLVHSTKILSTPWWTKGFPVWGYHFPTCSP